MPASGSLCGSDHEMIELKNLKKGREVAIRIITMKFNRVDFKKASPGN